MLNQLRGFFQKKGQEVSLLSTPLRLLVIGSLLLLAAFCTLWLFDKIFLYFLARSYVDDVAYVFNLNKHLAEVISLVVFVLVVFFVSRLFSLSKSNRLIGTLGLTGILIAHSLLLWRGTTGQFFDKSGKAIKCYVLSRDGEVRYLERTGIDAITGRACREVTPETVERLQEYAKGKRPGRVIEDTPIFFDLRTGEPIIWFWRAKSGEIELFNLMGFHPETGEELQPVNRNIVEEFFKQKREENRRPPQRIDPDTFAFFDPLSGKPRVWYWHGQGDDYEFYDNRGFHPRTGEALKIIDAEAIAAWKRDIAAELTRRQQEQSKREREQRERIERQEHEQQEALARQQREAQILLERQQREAQIGPMCDQAAGSPNDPRKSSDTAGVPYEELKEHAAEALRLCRTAIEKFPSELIRLPADYFGAAIFGHQWNPARLLMASRSLARAAHLSPMI